MYILSCSPKKIVYFKLRVPAKWIDLFYTFFFFYFLHRPYMIFSFILLLHITLCYHVNPFCEFQINAVSFYEAYDF